MGELWREIFEHSGMPNEGAAALRYLERCVELDPANIPARESLVVLYGKIGAWPKSLRHAVALLRVLRPGSVGRLASEALARMKLPDDDVDALLRRFSRGKEEAALAGPARPEGERWTKVVDFFQDLKGCRVATLVTVDDILHEAPGNERVDKQALAKGVNGLLIGRR